MPVAFSRCICISRIAVSFPFYLQHARISCWGKRRGKKNTRIKRKNRPEWLNRKEIGNSRGAEIGDLKKKKSFEVRVYVSPVSPEISYVISLRLPFPFVKSRIPFRLSANRVAVTLALDTCTRRINAADKSANYVTRGIIERAADRKWHLQLSCNASVKTNDIHW